MSLIQELLHLQHTRGYLKDDDLRQLAARLHEPLYRIEELASFFPHFHRERPPALEVHVCDSMSCALRGSRELCAAAQARAESRGVDPKKLQFKRVPCLGQCDHAPAAFLHQQRKGTTEHAAAPRLIPRLQAGHLDAMIDWVIDRKEFKLPTSKPKVHTNRPWTIDPYEGQPVEQRYQTIARYFQEIERQRMALERAPDERDALHKEVARLEAELVTVQAIVTQTEAAVDAAGTVEKPRLRSALQQQVQAVAKLRHELETTARLLETKQHLLTTADQIRTALQAAARSPLEMQPAPAQVAREVVRRDTIKALETAGLLGMGGAGGRAYLKWTDVYEAVGKRKYVVCNADESEPGTFKDRELLLHAPHLLVESMILAGLTVGAEQGYIYVRHEFEPQIETLKEEVKKAVRRNVCGRNILGSGEKFELEVFTSPGGYICGEQTALIEVLEDKRSEPRNRPPELQTNGLFQMPTLLHNVETLSWVPAIVLQDAGRSFAAAGKPGFKGRRFFSISGDLERPGVYEVANGTTLRELIELAGGMADGREARAVALSGPSGGFLPRNLPRAALSKSFAEKNMPPGATHFDLLDMQLDIGRSREMGVMLGAAIVVYDDRADLVAQSQVCSEFYRDESCGKCVPCRLGSRQMAHWAGQLAEGPISIDSRDRMQKQVESVAGAMKEASICGLGQVAFSPLQTLLKHFGDDVVQANGTRQRR